MKTPKFTPGPWSIETNEYGHILKPVNDEFDVIGTLVTSKQNARLIAAAPEMYEALCMLEYSHTAEQQDAFFKKMHRVLAKVRGE